MSAGRRGPVKLLENLCSRNLSDGLKSSQYNDKLFNEDLDDIACSSHKAFRPSSVWGTEEGTSDKPIFRSKRRYLKTNYILFPDEQNFPEVSLLSVTSPTRKNVWFDELEIERSFSDDDNLSLPRKHHSTKRRFKTPRSSFIAFLLPPNKKDRNVRFVVYAFIFLFMAYLLNLLFVAIGLQITRMMFDFKPELIVLKDMCTSSCIPFDFEGIIRSPSYVDLHFEKLRMEIIVPSITPDKPLVTLDLGKWTFYGHNYENRIKLPLALQLDESYGMPDFFSNDDFITYKIGLYFEVDLRCLWLPSLLPFYINPREEYSLITSHKRVVPFILHQFNVLDTTEDIMKMQLLLEYDHSLSYLKLSFPPIFGYLTMESYNPDTVDEEVEDEHVDQTIAHLALSGFEIDPVESTLVVVDLSVTRTNIENFRSSIKGFIENKAIRASLHFDMPNLKNAQDISFLSSNDIKDTTAECNQCFLFKWFNRNGGLRFSYNFRMKEETPPSYYYYGAKKAMSRVFRKYKPDKYVRPSAIVDFERISNENYSKRIYDVLSTEDVTIPVSSSLQFSVTLFMKKSAFSSLFNQSYPIQLTGNIPKLYFQAYVLTDNEIKIDFARITARVVRQEGDDSLIVTEEELMKQRESYAKVSLFVEIFDLCILLHCINKLGRRGPLFLDKWFYSLHGLYSSQLTKVSFDDTIYIAPIRQHNLLCYFLSPFILVVPLQDPLSWHIQGFPEAFEAAKRIKYSGKDSEVNQIQERITQDLPDCSSMFHEFAFKILGSTAYDFECQIHWKFPNLLPLPCFVSDPYFIELSWKSLNVDIFLENLIFKDDKYRLDTKKEFLPFMRMSLEASKLTYVYSKQSENFINCIFSGFFKMNLKLINMERIPSLPELKLSAISSEMMEDARLINLGMFLVRSTVYYKEALAVCRLEYVDGYLIFPYVVHISDAKSPWATSAAFWPTSFAIENYDNSRFNLSLTLSLTKAASYFYGSHTKHFKRPAKVVLHLEQSMTLPISGLIVNKPSETLWSYIFDPNTERWDLFDIFIPSFVIESYTTENLKIQFCVSRLNLGSSIRLLHSLSLTVNSNGRIIYVPSIEKVFPSYKIASSWSPLALLSTFLPKAKPKKTRKLFEKIMGILLYVSSVSGLLIEYPSYFVPLPLLTSLLHFSLDCTSDESSVSMKINLSLQDDIYVNSENDGIPNKSDLSSSSSIPNAPDMAFSSPLTITCPSLSLVLAITVSEEDPVYIPFFSIWFSGGILQFRTFDEFIECFSIPSRTSTSFEAHLNLFGFSGDTYRLRQYLQRILYTRALMTPEKDDIDWCFGNIYYQINFKENSDYIGVLWNRSLPENIHHLLKSLYDWVMVVDPFVDIINRDHTAYAFHVYPSSKYFENAKCTGSTVDFELPCIIPVLCSNFSQLSIPCSIRAAFSVEKLGQRLLDVFIKTIKPYTHGLLLKSYPATVFTEIRLDFPVDIDLTISGSPFILFSADPIRLIFISGFFVNQNMAKYPAPIYEFDVFATISEKVEDVEEFFAKYFIKADFLLSFNVAYNDPEPPPVSFLQDIHTSPNKIPLRYRPCAIDFSTNYIFYGTKASARKRGLNLFSALLCAGIPEFFPSVPSSPGYVSPIKKNLISFEITKFNRHGVEAELELDFTFGLPAFVFSITRQPQDFFELRLLYENTEMLKIEMESIIISPYLGTNTIKIKVFLPIPDEKTSELFSDFMSKINLTRDLLVEFEFSWKNRYINHPVMILRRKIQFPSFSSPSKFAEPLGYQLHSLTYQIRFNNTIPKCWMYILLFHIDLIPEDLEFYYHGVLEPSGLPNISSWDCQQARRIKDFQRRHWNILPYQQGQISSNPIKIYEINKGSSKSAHPCLSIFQNTESPLYSEIIAYMRCIYADEDIHMTNASFLQLSYLGQTRLPNTAIYDFNPHFNFIELIQDAINPPLCSQIRGELLILIKPNEDIIKLPENSEPLYIRIAFMTQKEDIVGGCFSSFNCLPSYWRIFSQLKFRIDSLEYEGSSSESSFHDKIRLKPLVSLVVCNLLPIHSTIKLSFDLYLDVRSSLVSILNDRIFEIQFATEDVPDIVSPNELGVFSIKLCINPKSFFTQLFYFENDDVVIATGQRSVVSTDIPRGMLVNNQIHCLMHYFASEHRLYLQLTEKRTHTTVYSLLDVDLLEFLGHKNAQLKFLTSDHLSVEIHNISFSHAEPDLNLQKSRLLFTQDLPATIHSSVESVAMKMHDKLDSVSSYLKPRLKNHFGFHFFQFLDSCNRPISYPADFYHISFTLTPTFARSSFRHCEQYQLSAAYTSLDEGHSEELAKLGIVPFIFKPHVPGRYIFHVCLSPLYGLPGDNICTRVGSIYITLYP